MRPSSISSHAPPDKGKQKSHIVQFRTVAMHYHLQLPPRTHPLSLRRVRNHTPSSRLKEWPGQLVSTGCCFEHRDHLDSTSVVGARLCAAAPAAGLAAGQTADDDVEERDDAINNGHADGADGVDDGHDDIADGAEDGLDLGAC